MAGRISHRFADEPQYDFGVSRC